MDYKMPKVILGDSVYWFAGGNPTVEPAAAVVTRIGRDNICVNILSPTSYNFLIRDGVRHVDDPRAPVDQKEEGGWMHREDHLARENRREQDRQTMRQLQDEQASLEAHRLQTAGK